LFSKKFILPISGGGIKINPTKRGNGAMKKTKQLLAYLIQNNPSVSITSLMKLSYLVDLVAIKKNNKKISDFEYQRYKYGPFDNQIYIVLKDLMKRNIIYEDSALSEMGEEFIIYKHNDKADFPLDQITLEEKEIIDEVVRSLKGYGAKALTELTYRTKPMQKIGAKIGNDEGLNQKLDLTAK
jgi:uncharacterized phage-associated protein